MSARRELGGSAPWAVPPPESGPVERWEAPPELAGDPAAPGADIEPGAGTQPGSGTKTGAELGPGAEIEPGAGTQPGDRDRRGRRRARGAGVPERPAATTRLAPRPPGTRRYLVLGEGQLTDDIAAVDADSGVLVRLQGGLPATPDGTVEPFDVVDAVVSAPGVADDPSRPEALLVAGPLQRAGVRRGRAVRRQLRSMVAPPEPHLLGFPGTTWPFWELTGGRPSVAVVTPSRGPMLFRRSEDGSAWVRFGWYRTDNWLPLQDRRAVAALEGSGRRRLSGKALVGALGFRPVYLVVAVGLPRAGYCTKSVLALLPKS